ncbi:MAG: hypothetical protein ACOC1X_02100 [Promethearchaeota archaeon]
MWEKQKIELEKETVELIDRLMRMRKERKTDDPIDFNLLLRHLIQKEIQFMKDEFPTTEDLRERNKQRREDLNTCTVYCPMFHKKIQNLTMCHLSCYYGHMTECHYPYNCDSEFCQHYPKEELNEVQKSGN